MRKLVALLMALTMMLGMVSFASADDTYNLDIYWVGNGDNSAVRQGVEEAINAYIEPLIGATVTFHIIGWDDWTDKAVNALQSGEKMDLIFTADWREYGIEVSGGLLQPLDDLLEEYGQGIKETLPQTFLDGVKVNGVLYGIPTNKELCVPEGYLVNVTAAKEIGWDVQFDDPTIKTVEDLEPWLAAYKEKYPNKYPYLMDGAAGRWPDEPWVADWASLDDNYLAMKMAADENGEFDETIYSIFETPEQEAHIRTMYKYGQAGYIDPDAALTSFDYNGTFGRGDFLVMTAPLKGNNIKATEMYEANHTVDFEYTEITTQPKYVITVHAGGSMFGIPVTSQNPAAAMKYLNLMHSDKELVNLMLFGVEGVNYTKVNDEQVEISSDANWYGVHGGAWTVGNTLLQYVTTAEDPQKNALLQSYADDAVATASLGFRFTKDPVADQIAAVAQVIKEYAEPLMCGQVDPDNASAGIEALKAALKDAGVDEVKAEVQAQYDAWKAAQE
ncbi:MAG: extracellular solute-binding protein [Clostridia bacterium]|nr:extracellular solute-binding protein [Clostridia bacterium]